MTKIPNAITPANLNSAWRERTALLAMKYCITEVFPGRIAVSSSFGAESAVLLDLIAKTDKATPILFLETGMHFKETLAYRDELAGYFGLTNIVIVTPEDEDLRKYDPEALLHLVDNDKCCEIRKVSPMDKALAPYEAWITGRKRYQNETRQGLPIFETGRVDKIKINPLANWTEVDVRAYMDAHDLPRHTLVSQGYPSIGCQVCTSRVKDGENSRAGRWRGEGKTECGIHVTKDGKMVQAKTG